MNASSSSIYVAPFDDTFRAPEWMTLSQVEISKALNLFDTDPNVITAYNFRLNALLSGGLLFRKNGRVLQPRAQEFMNQHCSSFIRSVLRYRWAVGIAACIWVPDAEFGGRPLVLDLTQIITVYQVEIYGEYTFRYFYKPRDSQKELEIKNVSTFIYHPPRENGSLSSYMSMLIPDRITEIEMEVYQSIAMKARCAPPMISEADKPQYDKDNVSAPMARSLHAIAHNGSNAMTLRQGIDDDEDGTGQGVVVGNISAHMNSTQPLVSAAMTQSLFVPMVRIPYFSSHYRMEQGRRFVAAPLPSAPENVIEFRTARQERVFALLGVPHSLVFSTGTGANGRGSNDVAVIMFTNSQKALKIDMINCLRTMWLEIHLKSDLTEYFRKTPPKQQTIAGARASCEISIEIPSLPHEETLHEWFRAGLLKYDAYIDQLSTMHGVPRSCFNDKPAIALEDLLGIKDDAAAPPAKKAKTK